jgi:hypothetical protein
MKTIILSMIFSICLVSSGFAQCEDGQGGGGNGGMGDTGQMDTGRGSAQGPMYDPSTVDTVDGTLLAMDTVAVSGQENMISMLIKSDQIDSVIIILGPQSFLDEVKFMLNPDDTLQVIGSRMQVDGREFVIAAQIQRGNDVWILRDENGVPMWSGRRDQ